MLGPSYLEEIKASYRLWRGSHRATTPPPHWDHLSDDTREIAIGMFQMGMRSAAEIVDHDPELRDAINRYADNLST